MCIIDDLTRATQRARSVMGVRRSAATDRQVAVLRVVAERGACINKDITDTIGMDRSTVTDVTRRLAERGLITRKRSKEDARRVELSVTASGRSRLVRADGKVAEAEKAILQNIPLADRPAFRAMLKAVAGIEQQHLTSAERAER